MLLRVPFATRKLNRILKDFDILTASSGDMLNPKKKYNLEYYLDVVDKIVNMGAHVLGIKDSQSTPFSQIY